MEIDNAISMLPIVFKKHGTTSGEGIFSHSGAAWKRVLQYRIAAWEKPSRILETHGGEHIGTQYYLYASPGSDIVSCQCWESDIAGVASCFDLIDVDPYACPLEAVNAVRKLLCDNGIMMVTSGMAYGVRRGIGNASEFKGLCGVRLWVEKEYLPELKQVSQLEVRHFYIHHHMVRAVLSNTELPSYLFNDCPKFLGKIQP